MSVLIEGRADGRWTPPAGVGAQRKYPWVELEPGESFFVPRLPDLMKWVAMRWGRKLDRVFVVESDGRGCRVRRTA